MARRVARCWAVVWPMREAVFSRLDGVRIAKGVRRRAPERAVPVGARARRMGMVPARLDANRSGPQRTPLTRSLFLSGNREDRHQIRAEGKIRNKPNFAQANCNQSVAVRFRAEPSFWSSRGSIHCARRHESEAEVIFSYLRWSVGPRPRVSCPGQREVQRLQRSSPATNDETNPISPNSSGIKR